jgi:predicted O-linked N-acetylglucosamine transferase (SPINDLY family)
VITQPSKYLRGRFTKAFYERMGIIDGIALSSDEYANKVIGFVEIEDEIEKLSKIEERIYDNRHLVFNDDHSVTEWDNILLKLYIKMPKNIEE